MSVESLFARVPSSTTVADRPSRLDVSELTAEGVSRVTVRRKSKPISPKVYAQLLNTKRKRKVHEVSKPMASLSLIPFPFALHSLSSSRSAVTHGHHKPKQGREVSYTNSSQFHKVSPWAKCLKGWVSSKNCFHSLSISSPQTRGRQHTPNGCVCPLQTSVSQHGWVKT